MSSAGVRSGAAAVWARYIRPSGFASDMSSDEVGGSQAPESPVCQVARAQWLNVTICIYTTYGLNDLL